MVAKVSLKPREDRWQPVKIGDQSFEVLVRPIDFGAKMRVYSGGRENVVEARIKATIVDWRGLSDEQDQPIPFSWENLAALCAQSDEVLGQLIDYSRGNLSEEEEKNSDAPRSEPSGDAANAPNLRVFSP